MTPEFVHSLSIEELTGLCRDLGRPAYRARQIWEWLYVHRADSWSAMTNLPPDLKEALAQRLEIKPVQVQDISGAPGETRKLLLRLRDEERIETAVIPAANRTTVCLSSQVGCRYGCSFCASGQAGFIRNLAVGEIVGQFLEAWRVNGDKPSHVVVMGVGEPFDNYDGVLAAVRILNDGKGLNIGARRITISTCGVVPGIERLARENLQVELSISLHAPTDELRGELMPVNRKHPLSELLAACRAYTEATNRIITFEYTLIRGVNDLPEQAARLVELLSPLSCRVNLIALSPVQEFEEKPSAPDAADRFAKALSSAGINTTFRVSRGKNIDAACGQLRARKR